MSEESQRLSDDSSKEAVILKIEKSTDNTRVKVYFVYQGKEYSEIYNLSTIVLSTDSNEEIVAKIEAICRRYALRKQREAKQRRGLAKALRYKNVVKIEEEGVDIPVEVIDIPNSKTIYWIALIDGTWLSLNYSIGPKCWVVDDDDISKVGKMIIDRETKEKWEKLQHEKRATKFIEGL